MGVPVEIGFGDELPSVVKRFVLDEDGAEDGPLCLEIVGERPFESSVQLSQI